MINNDQAYFEIIINVLVLLVGYTLGVMNKRAHNPKQDALVIAEYSAHIASLEEQLRTARFENSVKNYPKDDGMKSSVKFYDAKKNKTTKRVKRYE